MLTRPLHNAARLLLFLSIAACTSEVAEDADTAASSTDGTDTTGAVEETDKTDATETTDATESTLGWNVTGNVVTFTWTATGAAHERLVIAQGKVQIEVKATAGSATVTSDLSGFEKGPADYRIETAASADFSGAVTHSTGTLTLGESFTNYYDNVVQPSSSTLEGIADRVELGATVTLTGNAGSEGVTGLIFIGRPDGAVDLAQISQTKNLQANESYSVEYTFGKPGVYVLELLATNGLPVKLVAVHAGETVPLVLNPLDYDPGASPSEPLPIDGIRQEMLDLVNDLRGSFGLSSLSQHPLANQSAQTKADDMRDNNYFGHTSPAGKKAKDLAADVGLTGTISENIVVEYTVGRAWWSWYWSPSHRGAFLVDGWQSVGLGVAIFPDGTGRLVLAQHLSSVAP